MYPILLVVALAVALSASSASAHLFRWIGPPNPPGHRAWFFEGHTYSNSAGTKVSDPLNILIREGGGTTASLDNVESHLRTEWASWGGGRMVPRKCLNARGNQWVAFKALNDLNAGQPSRWVDDRDRTMSTSTWCHDQWHIRLWDDVEHDIQTGGHGGRDKWIVGNIHHDNFIGLPRWHEVDVPWESGEWKLIHRWDEHCSWKDWKVVPGSGGAFGSHGFRSNGRITLFRMKHVPDC